MEITKDKITEIFCIIDEFCQEYDKEIARMSICEPDGRKHRNRKWTMSRSEIMTILICFHFNTFRNFNPNRSLEKVSCHFLMTAIRKIALYMLDS